MLCTAACLLNSHADRKDFDDDIRAIGPAH
jgi:hypothetical protein